MWVRLAVLGSAAAAAWAAVPPPLDSFASTWQAIRTCDTRVDTVPCPAEAKDEFRCHDFGCCWDAIALQCRAAAPPYGEGALTHSPRRYGPGQAPPGLSALSGQARASSDGDVSGVDCFVAPPFTQTCVPNPGQPGPGLESTADSLLPVLGGPVVVNGVSVVSGAKSLFFRWFPHELLRKAELGGFIIESAARMANERVGLMLETVTTAASGDSVLNISLPVAALVRDQRSVVWQWAVPRPGKTDEFRWKSHDGSPTAVSVSDTRSSCSVGVVVVSSQGEARIDGTGIGGMPVAHFSVELEAGKNFTLRVAACVGRTEDEATSCAREMASSWEKEWNATAEGWKSLWDGVFKRGSVFPGSFPTLDTDDTALSRVYYTGLVSFLTMASRNEMTEGRVLFGTGGPVNAITTLYLWDTYLNSVLWSTLDWPTYLWVMEKHLSVDIHNIYALDYVSGQGVGVWYAFNDLMAFRGLETLVRWRGVQVLDTVLANKTVAEWLYTLSTNWQRLTNKDWLTDYGLRHNLLECVPTYIHMVPSLQAANAWMMRVAANALELSGGGGDRPKTLRAWADAVSNATRSRSTPSSFHESVERCYNRLSVVDFHTIAVTLGRDDLSSVQQKEMLSFVERELFTPHWMRALSLEDKAAPISDRKDHGPWLGETVEALGGGLGRYDMALGVVHRMSAVYDRAAGTQSHQVFSPNNTVMLMEPDVTGTDQLWYCLSGSVTANRVLTSLLGLHPPMAQTPADPKGFLRDATSPRGFEATLEGVWLRGTSYTVVSSASGLSIHQG